MDRDARASEHQWVPSLSRFRQDPALLALGEAIRILRIEQEISQEQLALVSGVDRSYMGRVERGDNNAAVLTLVRIANSLDVSVADLFKRAGL